MMLQTNNCNIKSVRGTKHCQNCWFIPNGGRLTIKEISYLVVALFVDLVAPYLYICINNYDLIKIFTCAVLLYSATA